MALTYGFYNGVNHDRRYYSTQFSNIVNAMITDGVFLTRGNAFAVTPAANGLGVNVDTGFAWFTNTWTENDQLLPLTLTAADVSRPRIDAIVLDVNGNDDMRANDIIVVTGAPYSTPTKPTLINEGKHTQHALAYVTVNANATSILAENIEIVVGQNETPYADAKLSGIDITALFQQWQGEFETWFADVQSQLEGDVATNLLNKINALEQNKLDKVTDRATAEDLTTGAQDKWVSAGMLREESLPVGSIVSFVPSSGNFVKCQGQFLSADDYPELWRACGNKFGYDMTSNRIRISSGCSWDSDSAGNRTIIAFVKREPNSTSRYVSYQVYEGQKVIYDRTYNFTFAKSQYENSVEVGLLPNNKAVIAVHGSHSYTYNWGYSTLLLYVDLPTGNVVTIDSTVVDQVNGGGGTLNVVYDKDLYLYRRPYTSDTERYNYSVYRGTTILYTIDGRNRYGSSAYLYPLPHMNAIRLEGYIGGKYGLALFDETGATVYKTGSPISNLTKRYTFYKSSTTTIYVGDIAVEVSNITEKKLKINGDRIDVEDVRTRQFPYTTINSTNNDMIGIVSAMFNRYGYTLADSYEYDEVCNFCIRNYKTQGSSTSPVYYKIGPTRLFDMFEDPMPIPLDNPLQLDATISKKGNVLTRSDMNGYFCIIEEGCLLPNTGEYILVK